MSIKIANVVIEENAKSFCAVVWSDTVAPIVTTEGVYKVISDGAYHFVEIDRRYDFKSVIRSIREALEQAALDGGTK